MLRSNIRSSYIGTSNIRGANIPCSFSGVLLSGGQLSEVLLFGVLLSKNLLSVVLLSEVLISDVLLSGVMLSGGLLSEVSVIRSSVIRVYLYKSFYCWHDMSRCNGVHLECRASTSFQLLVFFPSSSDDKYKIDQIYINSIFPRQLSNILSLGFYCDAIINHRVDI